MLKLFVDDIRRCPDGWILARTVTEAIRILATQDVSEVRLNHNIICKPETGESHISWETFKAVARYLALLNVVRELDNGIPIKAHIHIANAQGGNLPKSCCS